jgi:hypothetical protein
MKITNVLGVSILTFMLAAGIIAGCKKSSTNETNDKVVNQDEKSMIAAAGFNSNWVEKTSEGKYLIEGDILLTTGQLQEMAGSTPSHNFIVANEEHYRTYNLVATPNGTRTITVSLNTNGFPAYYSTALDQALAHYNSYTGLRIKFQRVSSNGEIVITGADLGTSGGGCILGQSAGFPDDFGNPAHGFKLSTSSCAISYLKTADLVDEVMAHEIGHCIGFRHTDYKKRNSCGPGPGESAGTIGAVHINGTPTTVSASYDSWMMACTNGNPAFNAADGDALNEVY